jgi:hypothetical protein
MCLEKFSEDAELSSELYLISWEGLKNAMVNHIEVKLNESIFERQTCTGTRQANPRVINCCPAITVKSPNVLTVFCVTVST